MAFSVEFLDKSRALETLDRLYEIFSANMSGLGVSWAKDEWTGEILNGLQKPQRQLLLLKDGRELAGFFLYYVNQGKLMMEEIQFLPRYFGSGLFEALYSYLMDVVPPDTRSVEAYVHRVNAKSRGILAHLGLTEVPDGSDSEILKYRSEMNALRARYGEGARLERVSVGEGYDVFCGKGLLDVCGTLIRRVWNGKRCVVATDGTVGPLYLERAVKSLENAGMEVYSFAFPAGEAQKTMNTLSGVLEAFASAGLSRADLAIALGGGVVGDITGFAAGCYMRGMDFVQLPTTLLSAVDASVGGKTAVNLQAGKNLAGLFHQPRLVICDTELLSTLSAPALAEGAAEALKTGVVGDGELFGLLENGIVFQNLPEIIQRCVRVKAKIVSEDERDTGERHVLNLGHTYGHALETLSGYGISHGRAVAIGLCMAARAAVSMGDMSAEDGKRILRAAAACGLPTECPFLPDEVAKKAYLDKKRLGGELKLVIPKAIGKCGIRAIPAERFSDYARAGMK